MKLTLTQPLTPVALAVLTVVTAVPVQAASFQQQEVDQAQFIAIARPYGGNKYDLLILQQLPGKRQCWQKMGNNPVMVNPLLLNFDFTGSCERSTDSNGYSIRLDGQDLGLDYLLRVVQGNGELVLVGTSRRNGNPQEMVIGRTRGLGSGFMKIELDPGWRFTKRAYNGRALSHVYLTGDRSAMNFSTPTASSTSSANNFSSGKTVREFTFTAPTAPAPTPGNRNLRSSNPPSPPVNPNVNRPANRTVANVPSPSSTYRGGNLLPPPPPPKVPRAANQSSVSFPPNAGVNPYRFSGTSYKVMAAVSNEMQQTQVRSLYPDAFPTSYKGQRVLQVGVFSTQENAQQAYQNLQNAGLRAIMTP
ncbi:MAG: DUF3747 domain-containing protein [Snowella sp.]|nr:DUF3747 domain-containing protein [Snowella sp.]